MRRSGPIAVACLLALSGTGAASATALASEDPHRTTVTIVQPKQGSSVPAGRVQIVISTRNFNVVNKMGDLPQDGEGLVYYYLDVDKIPTTPGQEATASGEGRYVAAPSKSYIWEDVKPGTHAFAVQLVKNNHRPLDQAATDEVEITVV